MDLRAAFEEDKKAVEGDAAKLKALTEAYKKDRAKAERELRKAGKPEVVGQLFNTDYEISGESADKVFQRAVYNLRNKYAERNVKQLDNRDGAPAISAELTENEIIEAAEEGMRHYETEPENGGCSRKCTQSCQSRCDRCIPSQHWS